MHQIQHVAAYGNPFDYRQAYAPDYVLEHVSAAAKSACRATGRGMPPAPQAAFEVDMSRINHCLRHLDIVRTLVEGRGGRLLSTVYLNDMSPLDVEDAQGRAFQVSAGALKQGSWSPHESRRIQDPDAYQAILERHALLRGGRVVSRYQASSRKMDFEDVHGNRFQAVPTSVRQGHWSIFESPLGGARSIPAADGLTAVRLRSGATVVYRIVEDGTLRMHEATSADGCCTRQWDWEKAESPRISEQRLRAAA